MLEFNNDTMIVLPSSNLIQEIVNYKSINKVYYEKYTEESYSIYRIVHDLIDTLRNMKNDPDGHSYKWFDSIMEGVTHELNIPEDPEIFERFYVAFLKDIVLLSTALEESKITEISNPIDVYRLTQNNIYLTIINLTKA